MRQFSQAIRQQLKYKMLEEKGVTKVSLHKQEPAGLVEKVKNSKPVTERQEDPDELTSGDFQQAADKAQVRTTYVAWSM